MTRAVVTGGTGFIGSWLVKELAENGVEVIMLVRSLRAEPLFNEQVIKERINKIKYNDPELKNKIKRKGDIDVFFHVAWCGVDPTEKENSELQLTNISFSMQMLELAINVKAKRFIAVGTVAEYAMTEGIMDLEGRPFPNDIYAATKVAVHYYLETLARANDMPFNWVILASSFGEGRTGDNIITYTICKLLKNEAPEYGSLEQLWDFLYVGESVRALRLIAEKGFPGKNYAIGSGECKPIRHYIEIIRDMINPALELGIGKNNRQTGKAFSSCVDLYVLTKDTGFKPELSFKDAIEKTIRYYKNYS